MYRHFIWDVVAASYSYRNDVQSTISCYNFSKIYCVTISYRYPNPYLCSWMCILTYTLYKLTYPLKITQPNTLDSLEHIGLVLKTT